MRPRKSVFYLFFLFVLSVHAVATKGTKRKRSVMTCNLPAIAHSLVTFEDGSKAPSEVAAGTKVFIFCLEGYHMRHGSNHSICLRRNRWLRTLGYCFSNAAVNAFCPMPVVSNGIVLQVGGEKRSWQVPAGNKAMLQCDPGYYVNGNGVIVCLDSGEWSGMLGTCQQPPDSYDYDDKYGYLGEPVMSVESPEQQIKQQQQEAETLTQTTSVPSVGITTIRNDNGENNATSTVATTAVNCNFRQVVCPLPLVTNGKYYANSRVVVNDFVVPRTEVTLICNKGFAVTYDLTQSYCQKNGKWTGRLGHCQQVCGEVPKVKFGEFSQFGGYGLGVERILRCDSGYSPQGARSIFCLFNSTWSWPGSCVKYCNEVPKITNGFVGCGESTIGETRKIGCRAGYMLMNHDTITCRENRKWSIPEEACIEIDVCGPRPPLANATYDIQEERIWRLGAVIYFHCKKGFELFGPGNVTCLSPNLWTVPGFCSPSCGIHPIVINGSIDTLSSVHRPGILQIACKHGFEIYGERYIQCSKQTHQWTKPGTCLQACRVVGAVWPRPQALVAFWPLNKKATLTDVSPNSHNINYGTERATFATEVDGPFAGSSYSVTTNDQHIGYCGSLPSSSSFTISFYFFAMGTTSPIMMFYYQIPQLAFNYIAPSYLEVRSTNGMPAGGVIGAWKNVIVPERWNFVAVIFDSEMQTLSIYGRNGVIVDKLQIIPRAITGWENHHWFYLGKAPNDNGCCTGMNTTQALACVMIYNTPLVEWEVFQLQRSCRCQRTPT